MTFSTKNSVIKHQIESRKNIILLYIILGVVLFALGLYISDEVAPATFLYLGAILVALIFYFQINKITTNPTFQSVSSLRTIMFLFIAIFVVGLIVDVMWWEALYYTSFLGAVLAISGFFLMNLIITDGNLLVSLGQNPSSTSGGTKTKFCPNCGASLENLTSSNFCPSCGKQV